MHALDSYLTDQLGKLPSYIRPLLVALSFIGQPFFMGSVLIFITYVAAQIGDYRIALIGCISFGCLFISTILKHIVRRRRPDTYVPGIMPSYSFPSGHAYGTVLISFVVITLCLANFATMTVMGVILLIFIILTGISRVYLGAHYPTDVLAGWLLGIVVCTAIQQLTS